MFQVTDLVALGKYAEVRDTMWASLLSVVENRDNLDDFLAIPKDMLLGGLIAFESRKVLNDYRDAHCGSDSEGSQNGNTPSFGDA